MPRPHFGGFWHFGDGHFGPIKPDFESRKMIQRNLLEFGSENVLTMLSLKFGVNLSSGR